MISNADITLYNRYYNKETQVTEYKRTHIYDVNFQNKQSVSTEDKGLVSTDSVNVFIPFYSDFGDKKHIKPKAYQRLESVNNYFTFEEGDIIVKGIIDFELTGRKPNNFEYLDNMYDDVYSIISIITNDNGSDNLKHWEVGAK